VVKIKKILQFTIIILIVFCFANFVNAEDNLNISASIGNARMILYPQVIPGEPTLLEKSIAVYNINQIDVKVDLKPSDELLPYVTISDNSFVLKPGESKDAKFTINISQPGRYEGKILISFLPNDELNASGVGLASSIIVIAKQKNITENSNNLTDINETKRDDKINSDFLFYTFIFILAVLIISVSYILIKNNRGKRK